MEKKLVKVTDVLIADKIGMSVQNIRKTLKYYVGKLGDGLGRGKTIAAKKHYHYEALKIGVFCLENNIEQSRLIEYLKSKED
jgi:hypothetical protein